MFCRRLDVIRTVSLDTIFRTATYCWFYIWLCMRYFCYLLDIVCTCTFSTHFVLCLLDKKQHLLTKGLFPPIAIPLLYWLHWFHSGIHICVALLLYCIGKVKLAPFLQADQRHFCHYENFLFKVWAFVISGCMSKFSRQVACCYCLHSNLVRSKQDIEMAMV